MMRHFSAVATFILAIPLAAMAQPVPFDADIPPTDTASPASAGDPSGQKNKLLIQRVLVKNAPNLPPEEIEFIVARFENRALEFAQMQAITALLVEAYRNRGYLVARAYLPPQNVDTQGGDLVIEVVEGTFGRVNLVNGSLNHTAWLQGQLDNINGAVVSNATLEHTLQWLGSIPGTAVERASLKAGALPGTSDLEVALKAGPRVSAFALTDNMGSIYTGKQRLSAGAEWNAPLGYGDKLSIDAMSGEAGRLLNGRLAYSLPLGHGGLRGEIAASKTTYALGGEFSGLDAAGSSKAVDAILTYSLKKTASHSVDARLAVSGKRMQDDIRATNTFNSKSADVAVLALASNDKSTWWGMEGQTRLDASYTRGQLHLEGAARATDQAAGGANTHGGYAKLNIGLSRDMRLSPRVSGSFSIRAQQALMGKNLDGSEDFTVSGPNGVKAYAAGELSAENGYLASAELFYALPRNGGIEWSISVFAEHGSAFMQNKVAGFEERALADAGIGFYAQNEHFFSKLHIAMATTQDPVSESTARTKMLWQIGLKF